MANQLETTSAFNVDKIRSQLLEDVRPPKELVQKAFQKLEAQLEAKKVIFFQFRGEVSDERIVPNHAVQQNAADKILSAAGVYARDRDSKPPTPAIAMEYDSITGVLRLVIGSAAQPALPKGGDEYVTPEIIDIASGENAGVTGTHGLALSPKPFESDSPLGELGASAEETVQVLRHGELTKEQLNRSMFEFLNAAERH